MYTITKQFEFSASHQLLQLPEDHPCHRLHGHNYTVTVELTGELDENGFVLDYRALDTFKAWVNQTLDHRHLNDVLHIPPTAEGLARILFEQLYTVMGYKQASAVTVSETPKTTATYRRTS